MTSDPSSPSKGKPFIVEKLDEEEVARALWQSQVLIPFISWPNSHGFVAII
jgi:hypothetical protein